MIQIDEKRIPLYMYKAVSLNHYTVPLIYVNRQVKARNIMNSLDFTEEEIREQLAALGYRNIPKHRLLEFKKGMTI